MPEISNSNSSFNIPLKKIKFLANISGMFSQVTCEQEFENHSENSVEAVYIFPLPEEASVVGCEMSIGEKKIVAELKERKQARQEYEDAVSAGHHASLLEQKRDNIFRINVGGIEPDENVRITTTYNQRVSWQNHGGRFSIPLVVAPRFIPGIPSGVKTGDGWSENTDEVPDASEITPVVSKDGVPYNVDIKAVFSPGFECNISSPSHDLIVGEHKFTIDPVEIILNNLTPDRDFIICYNTDSTKIGSSIHKGKFDNENFLVIDVIPPGNVISKPKDIIFCLDISGSMSGPKLEGLKLVAEKVARRIQQQEKNNRIEIVAFESNIHPVHPLSEINESTFRAIQNLNSLGGTMAGKALDYCFQKLSGDANRERYILLVSDGQTEDRWSKIISGIRVIAIGIDTAVNMSYLSDIAKETDGKNLAVYPGEDYDTVAGTITGLLSGPILRDIKVSGDGEPLSDVFGENDVYISMPASITAKLDKIPKNIQVSGKDNLGKHVSIELDLEKFSECDFAHQIWAREKLHDKQMSESDIIAISLRYGVISNQTAYVAVHLKEVPGSQPQRVEIPVSLPHTWDYDKVFEQPPMLFKSVSMNYNSIMPSDLSSPKIHELHSIKHSIVGASSDIDDIKNEISNLLGNIVSGMRHRRTPSRHSYSHLTDELENLVNVLESVNMKRELAENMWKNLLVKIENTPVTLWTATQKAKAYYYLLKLKTFGFKAPTDVINSVSVEPDRSDTSAWDWWKKAQQVLGLSSK